MTRQMGLRLYDELSTLARFVEARVPIVKRSDKEPFSTCIGCGHTDGKPCAPGCWVYGLQWQLERARVALRAAEEREGARMAKAKST